MFPPEEFLRAFAAGHQKAVNGDAARSYVRVLLAELTEQRRLNVALAERVAAQSELLSKKAEKK